ncbi:histone deacetylase family protein [Desulfovibrio mangrovi]|uniref:histone deacetylase family protein n=1 Tax=Desulfovibrio mangrovi TaxID=2976983 RepID=UPI002248426A|nr:histone deacetylase family protein [Desulfovibrio mangrovi]UZP67076.1 histone deacetylase family protein [Desulfovibrio mangrovi]
MFRIRPIYDTRLPIDIQAVEKAQEILRERFPLLDEEDVQQLPDLLANPFIKQYRSILFVAEDGRANVRGFALLCHFADLHFCYLDFISVSQKHGGGGIGSVLYERIREEARALGDSALFFECLPDDPALCRDAAALKDNIARLRFYERYGARPIIGTAYETPLVEGGDCPPYLVADPLGKPLKVSRTQVRKVVRAILTRKYKGACSPEYTEMVVNSFNDPYVRLREPRYIIGDESAPLVLPAKVSGDMRIALVVNDKHDIHHVRERGYVESPVRIDSIRKALAKTGLFEELTVRHYPESHITAVHDKGYVSYLKTVCAKLPANKSLYPYVFPIRNASRPPHELPVRAGYYCIDTFTPLNANAYNAAKRAVDCGLTAAESLLSGRRMAYALVRPPGHHAERKAFGGFCYFNTAAVAANRLSALGKVAVLDIDYHHGNGTQNIFYKRNDVLTVSIHGHPRFAYPYFSGFSEEVGEEAGAGFNRNFPLMEKVDGHQYANVLVRALQAVREFNPTFLVVGLGLDPAKGDPTGTWSLAAKDFVHNGRLIGRLGLHTLVVQEGGYRIRSLGVNARNFFVGLYEGMSEAVRR